jgi:hypothetical protein
LHRMARLILVLAAMAASSCNDAAAPVPAASAPVIPTAPTRPFPTTYSLSGTVKEAWIDTGLPGATVTIASGPSSGSTVTSDEGRYTLSNLLPGTYRLTFSKGAPYGSVGSGPVTVSADAEVSGALSLTGGFPVSAANLQGYWAAQGPYPNEPCRILLIQNGTKLEGWYKDSRDYSTSMSGTYTGGSVFIRVGTTGLTIEGRVEDERCMRAVIKNEALGGNFPVEITRGGSCSR